MGKFTDLNGIWTGSYGYPSGAQKAVAFTAWIDDRSGAIAGTILEPNTFADTPAEELSSTINGARSDLEVAFTKIYDQGQGAHGHEIEYTGKSNSDFTWIVGRWRIGGWIDVSGSFEMSRQSGAFEKIEQARELEITR